LVGVDEGNGVVVEDDRGDLAGNGMVGVGELSLITGSLHAAINSIRSTDQEKRKMPIMSLRISTHQY
jgi:hypothetical protein